MRSTLQYWMLLWWCALSFVVEHDRVTPKYDTFITYLKNVDIGFLGTVHKFLTYNTTLDYPVSIIDDIRYLIMVKAETGMKNQV